MKHLLVIGSFTMSIIGLAATASAEEANRPVLPQPVAASDLAQLSGGALPSAIAATTQELTASNSNNSVIAGGSIATGDITVPANAFSGYNGVGNFVFNTGNNNNLQGSLSITIMTPAP